MEIIEKKYFSTTEVLEFLKHYAGMDVSKSALFNWSATGFIPCKKAPNGRLLFPVADVQKWIDGTDQKKATNPEG